MTVVAQRHKHWCALACLESASKDQGGQWTQEDVQKIFGPIFPPPENVMKPYLLPTICFSIGIGNCFHLGKEKDFVFPYRAKLKSGEVQIFVCTEKDKNGGAWGHCLRMSEMSDDVFKALDPAAGKIDDFQWDYLKTHDCLIYIVGRAVLPT